MRAHCSSVTHGDAQYVRAMCAPACARFLHVFTCLAVTKHSEVALQHAFSQSVPKFAHVQCTALAGTYLGLVEKLPYLQVLGINAIELLPIHEFNELEYYQARAPTGSAYFAWQPCDSASHQKSTKIVTTNASSHSLCCLTWMLARNACMG